MSDIDIKNLKIGIVGAGAVGGTFATFLAHAGYDVEITKHKFDGLIMDNMVSLEVTGALGTKSYLVPFKDGNKFSDEKDIIFICTRAFSVKEALGDVKKYLKRDGIVVVPQNVLSLQDVLSEIPSEQFVPMVIDWVGLRDSDNEFVVLTSGNIHIGAISPNEHAHLPRLQKVLSSISNTVVQNNMYPFILSRFLMFCNTSVMGALTGHKLGHYLKEKQAKRIFINLFCEQLNVLAKQNIEVPPYNGVFDYYTFVENTISGILYRSSMFKRLINKNGENVSPTLRLLENNKKSEKDYMCRQFVNMAKANGMEIPYNETMADILDEIEKADKNIVLENIYDERFLEI